VTVCLQLCTHVYFCHNWLFQVITPEIVLMLIWWWRYIYYNYCQYWKLFNNNHWYGIWIMDWGHRPQHFLNHCSKGNAHSSLLDCSHVGMHTVGWWPPTFKSLSLWRPLQPVMHGICHKTWSTLLNTVNPTVTLLSINLCGILLILTFLQKIVLLTEKFCQF